MSIAKCCRLLCHAALIGSIFSVAEASLNPHIAKAEAPLNANEYNWINYNLVPGSYILEASSFWGDVDVELYDSDGDLVLEGVRLGDESVSFTVYQPGVFVIKYSMLMCFNPFGACDVDVEVVRL